MKIKEPVRRFTMRTQDVFCRKRSQWVKHEEGGTLIEDMYSKCLFEEKDEYCGKCLNIDANEKKYDEWIRRGGGGDTWW